MSRPPRRKVLLVGWDGADWKLIQPLLDGGEMPVLERVINGGVMGNLGSIRPMLSPMLWTSIGTGKRPFKHGVPGFTEIDREFNQVVPVGSHTRQCKALWNILNERGLKTHVVSWFATHPAEPVDGGCVTDRFANPVPSQLDREWRLSKGTVHPERLEKTMADLRVRPEEIPGDVLSMFVRGAATINQEHDKRLHLVAMRLSEAFTTHAAATYLLEHEPWDFATIYYHDLDLLCHDFMAYHPPRMHGVYAREFELYSDVVNSAYRLHDAMLGRLLQIAGEDTTVIVVSDHGFKSGYRRPLLIPNVPAGIAAWHRVHGIFAARGPGLRRDELIHGASLLDVTPTILALFGLPVGNDMDGRVLAEIFSEPPHLERIESWENTSPSGGTTAPVPAQRSPNEEKELVRQFVEIGYIQDPGDDPQEAIRSTERQNQWAMAESYLSAGRYEDALPLLESVFEEWPERWDFCCELALCQLNLDLIDEARETLEGVIENKKHAAALLLRANLEYRSRNFEAGANLLERAEAIDATLAPLQNQLGMVRMRMRQPKLAEIAFRKAIDRDPDDAQGFVGVAACRLRARDYQAAADYALRALALRFDIAPAHQHLGVALARLGDRPRAIQALETCLRYQPSSNPAHRYLAYLYSKQPGGAADAERHREYLRGRMDRRQTWRRYRLTLRREIISRARQRAETRRRVRASARSGVPEQITGLDPTEFLLVSGLPRSGTSLMMQMLAAAGLPIMTDEERGADEDNARGYFEWEGIKELSRNPYIIEKAAGRVVKVISMLIPSLPSKHRYRVIFMQRAIEDVSASQQKLRQRLSESSAADTGKMTHWLGEHRNRTLNLLRESPNVEVIEVEYADLLANPRKQSERVAKFARLDPAKIDTMATAVDPSLRHFDGVTMPASSGPA